jgi:peptidylamidoglycolate lyase
MKVASLAVAGLALPGVSRADEACCRVTRIGTGYHTYELDPEWGALPDGQQYGIGCGIVVDGKDRVYVLTRAKPGLVIFDRKGKLVEIWEEEAAIKKGFATETVIQSAHGLYWSKEKGREYLYFTENKSKTGNGGRRVTKTDLKGNVLLRIGNVDEESATSIKFVFDSPTDVAIGPNGDIYVVDGYGSQLVHRFDKTGKLIKTMGGRGKENGKFNICHGIWVNTLKKTPEIYIADRNNNRVEVYSMDLEYKRTLGEVRNPCCFYQHKKFLYIPDLGSRVTIFDADDKLAAHLGDGKGVKERDASQFIAPHAMTVDSKGNLYVLEWVPYGRVRKFKHTPQKA